MKYLRLEIEGVGLLIRAPMTFNPNNRHSIVVGMQDMVTGKSASISFQYELDKIRYGDPKDELP